jgi:ribose transport system substrate-binding protein
MVPFITMDTVDNDFYKMEGIMKRFLVITLGVILVITMSLIGCAGETPAVEEPAAEEPAEEAAAEEPAEEAVAEEPAEEAAAELPDEIVIGWTPPDITGVFKTVTDFYEKAAEDARNNGVNVEIVTQSVATHTAFGDQVAIIEDFISRDVDVIAISPIEVEPIIPALNKASEAGIPVVINNVGEPIEGVDAYYVGYDNAEAAAICAYAIIDYFGGPGVLGLGDNMDVPVETVLDLAWWEDLYKDVDPESLDININLAIIEGIAGGYFSQARLVGFHGVIDNYPGINVVATQAADWNREKGIEVTEDLLTANPPGELDAIWAASNEMGLGSMLTCENADRLETVADGAKIGDALVAISTYDGTPESINALKEGKLISEAQIGFYNWGWYSTAAAVALVLGLDVPEFINIRTSIGYQDNANNFYPEPVLEPIDWEGMKQGVSPSW